jgi:peroxiredoxin
MKSGVVVVLLSSMVFAHADLAIGDPAPPLAIKQWIKGEPVDLSAGKGKNVYVIEFWDASCRETIPYTSELQKKYKDRGVVFVGLTDEAPSMAKIFVEKMGAKMDYAVGVDERQTAVKTYMTPFGQERMPHAFIIDKEGRVVWHGHPMGSMEKALDEVLSGKFNLQSAQKYDRLTKLQLEYIESVNAVATRAKAVELANTIVTEMGNDASGLNLFAWRILADRRVKHRDTGLALKAATRAYELAGTKDPAIVDTYARALFENGQKQAAIEKQKAAIALSKDEGQRIEFEGTLKKYQRLMRESVN